MNKEDVIYPTMVIRSQAEAIELLEKENKQLKENLLKIVDDLYEELLDRNSGESYFTKYDGSTETTDVGYAFDGIDLFIEELKNKILKGE